MIAKFVFLLDISSLVLFAIAHAAAIGIYAILTFKSSIWTNVWGFGTVAIGLGMLMIAGFGVAIPYWDLVHGLTNVK